MVIKIVIGANAGDEGKGLMTDFFCHQSAAQGKKCLVVMHNGGAQRGHTVELPDKPIRHVFHHFGSGTFAGADTYLSEDFIVNPIIFHQEWDVLTSLGYKPEVYVSPECKMTTPFDMIINQIVEEHRSGHRHGSCGMGIFETLQRSDDKLSWSWWVTAEGYERREVLENIRDIYLPKRLKQYGIEDIPSNWVDIIKNPGLMAHFLSDVEFMVRNTAIVMPSWINLFDQLVFESGQGILLDQNNTDCFPHLTPSNTGIMNPLRLIEDCIIQENLSIEVCYVTRTYLTRHGAGPLENECPKESINPDMRDQTNVPNDFQGTLRYGKLDVGTLQNRVLKDFEPAKKYDAKLSLAITHCNECDVPDLSNMSLDFLYYSAGKDRNSVTGRGLRKCLY